MSSGSLKHNPARPHVLADKRHEYLPLIRIGHLCRDWEIQPIIFGQNNERRATLHAILYALAAHTRRMVIKILNWAGNIPNQPFYRFVGNIRPGTGHVRGPWRLRRRQENPAACKQANLQWSDHRSLSFSLRTIFSLVCMRLMKRKSLHNWDVVRIQSL